MKFNGRFLGKIDISINVENLIENFTKSTNKRLGVFIFRFIGKLTEYDICVKFLPSSSVCELLVVITFASDGTEVD